MLRILTMWSVALILAVPALARAQIELALPSSWLTDLPPQMNASISSQATDKAKDGAQPSPQPGWSPPAQPPGLIELPPWGGPAG